MAEYVDFNWNQRAFIEEEQCTKFQPAACCLFWYSHTPVLPRPQTKPTPLHSLSLPACGNAYAARDLATLKQITADDYVQIDVRGRSLNRTQWLDFVENRKAELTVESDDIRVRYYGQAAVVTGHWTYTKKDGDKEVVTYSRWTSVWTRYPDGWKRHAFQNTYINAQADQCAATSSH